MTRLIQANFARLFKFRPFWVCVILSVAVCLVNDVLFAVLNDDWVYKTGGLILNQIGSTALFIAAIFAPLYLGTDYACGTIRNKLTAGHSRASCYLASLIPVTSGTLIILAAYCVPLVAMSLIWGKNLGITPGEFCMRILIIVAAAVASSSLFTLLGMLIPLKSLTTAITIVSAFVLFQGSFMVVNLLNQPEYIADYNMAIADAAMPETEPNPLYIKEGALKNVLTAVTDVLPSGQMVRLQDNSMHNRELYPLYSFGILAVTTAAGVLVFRRKDLK
ncbi:MAG: ABC transporter permease [Oscillospiraceae bacterium]|nr:ABC transporter permease [Oscillospiraceae bacterium]